MSAEKRPAHIVLTGKILAETTAISTQHKANEPVVKALLDVLFHIEMEAEEAHKIALELAVVLDRLYESKQDELAEFAGEVIADLNRRGDEKKQSAVRLPAGIPNFPHP